MENKNLMPQAAGPVNRITTGQLPAELAELSEETLSQLGSVPGDSSASVAASFSQSLAREGCACSYDGDDAE